MRKEVEIVNKLGLHARPASEFVRCVIKFKSAITIFKGEENFSAASILEVLSANLWFRPVVGVVIGAGLAVAASPEELPSDEEVSPSPQRAVNGWAWMASTRQARAAW